MGRHDDFDPAPFYVSLGSAILRGLFALLLSFGLYAVLANIRDGRERSPVALQSTGAPTERTSQTSTGAPPPVGEATSRFAPSLTPSATPSDDLTAAAPRSADTTVQVLDGGAGRRRTDEVVAALRTLGYQVVAVNKAVRSYKVTTVFYSRGQEASARALHARDQRFAELDANPNLNQRVALHVVVGTDWR
ncbi:MAG: LytR C-terminal domain-containing protein [Egibacteraceae bacterium]